MARLEGIIYKTFDNYVVLRGFAPLGDLAKISQKSDSYQRNADNTHKKDIIKFLYSGKYTYFPDIILACRAANYTEFISKIGNDSDVDFTDVRFVEGLTVLKEYLPVQSHRARHSFLDIKSNKKLLRIDGNHRLEPFDEKIEWWYDFLNIPDDIKKETDKNKKEGWLKNAAEKYKENIEKKIIPFTIIFTQEDCAEDFEAGIFHNINFKHLPLKEESSLRIISERKTFDIDSLGEEYQLAYKLIGEAQKGLFKGIALLTPQTQEKDNVYRTSCLRIAQLICAQKEKNNKLKSTYTSNEFIDAIEEVIQSLRPVYKQWGKERQGSTALLASLVYFGLIDKYKQDYFIRWVSKNGINKIGNENISKMTSLSFVEMFEKVYQTKKSQVFISMQFGDPQSELIYEKIIRAIEAFNNESHRDIKITPVRIDEYLKGQTYTITDEILEAISSSSMLIADLSSGNKNVYHEIGYAMALAKVKDMAPSVVLLLKEDTDKLDKGGDLDKFVGFNIRGFSQLRFKSYETLIDKLKKQLKIHFEG